MEDIENQGKMEMVLMDICPTEDTVSVLMDYFLQPLLPVKSTKQHAPTLAQQEAVAKQAHAVVILYNYFHRKKHPELEFLDFVSFCELMTILKPQMLAYMKFMQLSKDKESKETDLEKQMSLTEKSVMDACCTCEQLDKVRSLPTLEALPVCKVAVLLVDSEGGNCYLQFSSITKGAWSLIEKEVDPVTLTGNGSENSQQTKGVYIRKRAIKNPTNYGDGQFRKIAISAITEATEFNQENLKVVESHLVYSLDKENAAVRFFIVKSLKSFSEDIVPISIRYVVDSLQGPLVKKDCISWSVTEAVEHFHMFPYAAIMSAWLSRDRTLDEVQNTVSVSEDYNADKSPMSREHSKTHAGDDSDGPASASSSAVHGGANINTNNVFQKGIMGSHKSSMPNTMMTSGIMDHCDFLGSTKEVEVISDINAVKQPRIGDTFCVSRKKTTRSSQSNIISVKEEIVETRSHINSTDLKVVVADTHNDDVVAYNHSTPHKDSTVDPQASDPKYVLHAIASSGNILTQSALKVILKKREKLSQQRREIEDEIAQCDKTILSILSGREEDLAAKLESLMEACTDINLTSSIPVISREKVLPRQDDQASITPVPAKRKKASDVISNLQKPCKELDEICHANSWGIPNYRLSQSKGQFQGEVRVEMDGTEISEKSEIFSNVFEARESAARHMLDKLLSIKAKQCDQLLSK